MMNLNVAGVDFLIINEQQSKTDELKTLNKSDIVLCGYSAFNEADLADEIASRSWCIQEVSRVYKYADVAVCGLKTRLNGFKQLSAIVVHHGKIADVVRRTQNVRGDDYENSDKIKIYKTKKVNAALLLDTDVLLPKNWERVSQNSDIIISIGLDFSDEECDFIGTLSQTFSLPYLLVGSGGIWWGEP